MLAWNCSQSRARIVAPCTALEANALATLEALGIAAAIVSDSGVLIEANSLLREADRARVRACFKALDDWPAEIGLPAGINGEPALALKLVRLDGADSMLVTVRAFGPRAQPDHVLTTAFRFTPGEAKLAAALMEGLSLAEAAKRQGIRVSTARSYLAELFRKTGTGRQGELIARLAGGRL
ncbi:hypothetical protein GJW-30_1_03560 [Variibacter gotjawalensis]|uniref:HTH luxR-type domain-containing protein n=1 Tax=Variibacter gotjawalensis TaxID=1333996 RepID=A0A0S3PYM8_9BRAD|nr:helix-turn-helix transcriptional regulator [Variibacter gotjawalensis]NIK46847.1 DNA-binding CsgD family transcriptional regulator [Variibacter gotjawalensis]RZS48751.1 DNA-binding CsgD family transcriptional regulator [Variibacter gotjawalensis]BAT61010.1 hypothetical protein GJW-30_1_03560 [Variibacter gotjawalensis]